MRSITPLLAFTMMSFSVTLLAGSLEPLPPGTGALDAYVGHGKWVIVKIWVSDCEVCNREAYQYVDFHEFHKDSDAVMLGISLDGDDQAAAQSFIERHQVPYRNLITDFATGTQWFTSVTGRRWIGTPTFLVYDPAGELRAMQIGAVPTELIEDFIASNSNTQ